MRTSRQHRRSRSPRPLLLEQLEDRCLPSRYALTDLGNLGGPQSAQAYDINDAGQVVGYATAGPQRAFLWQDGVMTDLGTLGGSASIANALNNVGQVVGTSRVAPGSSPSEVFLWEDGVMVNLGVGPGTAYGINDAGQVVGTRNSRGFLWQDGVVTDIGDFGGGASSAHAINEAGQVVGAALSTQVGTVLGPLYHAFLWQNGVMTDLGVLPGMEDSGAAAINSLGQIVGSSGRMDPETYEITSQAFLYSGGVMTALPVPSSESYAGDINESGQVVGTMRAGGGSSNYHAYIFSDGVATNLNSLIPAGSGFHLISATAINNAGQIVGYAYDSRGHYHAFLLTPVEEGTPSVNIGDVTITEGNTGMQMATFTLTLSAASSQPVTVVFATATGTAGGDDYEALSGTVTFAPGQTTQTVEVPVYGDRIAEPNETFIVNLSQATGAIVGDGQGLATIVDDEPRISINDVSRQERHSGTSLFVFVVTLSTASDVPVTVNFATANGTAQAGSDYTAQSSSITFAPGETSKTISIVVRGDRTREASETFFINLSSAVGALLLDGQGLGRILNDD